MKPLILTPSQARKIILHAAGLHRPAKMALERLYLDGRLMVTRNRDFHKVYDLPRNLLPDEVDTTVPGNTSGNMRGGDKCKSVHPRYGCIQSGVITETERKGIK